MVLYVFFLSEKMVGVARNKKVWCWKCVNLTMKIQGLWSSTYAHVSLGFALFWSQNKTSNDKQQSIIIITTSKAMTSFLWCCLSTWELHIKSSMMGCFENYGSSGKLYSGISNCEWKLCPKTDQTHNDKSFLRRCRLISPKMSIKWWNTLQAQFFLFSIEARYQIKSGI